MRRRGSGERESQRQVQRGAAGVEREEQGIEDRDGRDRADAEGWASKGKPTSPVQLAFPGQRPLCPPAKHTLEASSLAKAFSQCLLCADAGAGQVETRGI